VHPRQKQTPGLNSAQRALFAEHGKKSVLVAALDGVLFRKALFAQVLERYLDPLIVEFLIFCAKLAVAASGAIEELDHPADRGVRFSLKLGCAADVN